MIFGKKVAPRGLPVIELTNFNWTFPPFVRWANFKGRKLSLDYIKAELRWYLKGDPSAAGIKDKAKLWGEIADESGKVNSNYGQYLFRQCQLLWVIDELTRDPDSRRASAVILHTGHLYSQNKDVPCTYGINFRIRENKLHASVHMRSQDAVWGLGNDLPFFSIVQELVAVTLDKELGTLHLAVDSFHVYERHWAMLKTITVESGAPVTEDYHWSPVDCPRITNTHEARCLMTDTPDVKYPFTRWVYGEWPRD